MGEDGLDRVADAFEVVFHFLEDALTRLERGAFFFELGQSSRELADLLAELTGKVFLAGELVGLASQQRFDLAEFLLRGVAAVEHAGKLIGDLAGADIQLLARRGEVLLEAVERADLGLEGLGLAKHLVDAAFLVFKGGLGFRELVLEFLVLGAGGFEA